MWSTSARGWPLDGLGCEATPGWPRGGRGSPGEAVAAGGSQTWLASSPSGRGGCPKPGRGSGPRGRAEVAWKQNPSPADQVPGNGTYFDTLRWSYEASVEPGHSGVGAAAVGHRWTSQGQPARRRREEGWQLRPVLRIQGIFEKPKGTLDCSVALSLLGEVGGVRALGSPQGALGAEAATSLPPAKGNGTQLPLLPFPTAEPKKALLTRRWGPTGPLGTESFGRSEAQRDFQAAASIC